MRELQKLDLIEIAPPSQEISWLAVLLHQKHDNAEHHAESFSLNPGEKKHIDLVQAPDGDVEMAIWQIVRKAGVPTPDGRI